MFTRIVKIFYTITLVRFTLYTVYYIYIVPFLSLYLPHGRRGFRLVNKSNAVHSDDDFKNPTRVFKLLIKSFAFLLQPRTHLSSVFSFFKKRLIRPKKIRHVEICTHH